MPGAYQFRRNRTPWWQQGCPHNPAPHLQGPAVVTHYWSAGLPGPSVLCSSCRHNNVEHSHCTCQCVRGAPDAGHLAEQALSCAYCYGSGAALYSRQTDDIHLNGERALPGADVQGLRAEKCHLLGQRWDPGHKPWSWCHARALATTTLHR